MPELFFTILIILVAIANLFTFSLFFMYPDLLQRLIKNTFISNVVGGLVYLLSFCIGMYVTIQVAVQFPPARGAWEEAQAVLALFALLITQWVVYGILYFSTRKKKVIV